MNPIPSTPIATTATPKNPPIIFSCDGTHIKLVQGEATITVDAQQAPKLDSLIQQATA